jgi:hypothetical protein
MSIDKRTKTAGVGNLGVEETARIEGQILTREDTKTQQDILFENAAKSRNQGREKVNKLFIQAPAAQTRGAKLAEGSRIEPSGLNLGKMASAEFLEKRASAADANIAKNTVEFFEKCAYMTEAQKRYPELLKVAGSADPKVTPSLKARTSGGAPSGPGAVAVRSPLSGGAA